MRKMVSIEECVPVHYAFHELYLQRCDIHTPRNACHFLMRTALNFLTQSKFIHLTSFRAPTLSRAVVSSKMADSGESVGADVFKNGIWYHETLEDGLAISYRVRSLFVYLLALLFVPAASDLVRPLLQTKAAPSPSPPRRRCWATRGACRNTPRVQHVRSVSFAHATSIASSSANSPCFLLSRRQNRWRKSSTVGRARSKRWRW